MPGAPVKAGRRGGWGLGLGRGTGAESLGMRGVGPGPSDEPVLGDLGPRKNRAATSRGAGSMHGEPSIKHPTVKRGHKGQEKGAAGGCGVFRGEASGDKIGLRGQERRGEPTQGKHTEGPGWRGPSLGAPSEGRAKPHLILRILKHVAHTTLVFLKAEEDVPQPQGRHEDHEGIKRQVPEIDGVEEHGAAAAAAAGPLALTQGAEERPAASPGAKPKRRAPARMNGQPAGSAQCACA